MPEGRSVVTNAGGNNPGAPDHEPKTQTEPQGAQSADETSGLDELDSLRSYFRGPRQEHTLRPFSDWLRASAHEILNDEAGTPSDLFNFAKNWLNEKLLFGPAANVFALALKKYGDARNLFCRICV